MYNYLIAFVYKLILLIGNLDSFMMYELFNYTFFIFFLIKKAYIMSIHGSEKEPYFHFTIALTFH